MLKIEKKVNLTMCPKCGHVGPGVPFKLPSVSQMVENNSSHWEALLPGEKKPREFKKPPSESELHEMTMKALEKVQEEKLAELSGKKAPKKSSATPESDK